MERFEVLFCASNYRCTRYTAYKTIVASCALELTRPIRKRHYQTGTSATTVGDGSEDENTSSKTLHTTDPYMIVDILE